VRFSRVKEEGQTFVFCIKQELDASWLWRGSKPWLSNFHRERKISPLSIIITVSLGFLVYSYSTLNFTCF
jgi:hypothetical protein